jgi:hypothetical protein
MPEVLCEVVNDYHFRYRVFDALYDHQSPGPIDRVWWADSFASVRAEGATAFFDGACYGRTRMWRLTFPLRRLLLSWKRYRILKNWPWPKGVEGEGAGAALSDGEQLAMAITRTIGYRSGSRTERFLLQRREDTLEFLQQISKASSDRVSFHKGQAEHVIARIDALIRGSWA